MLEQVKHVKLKNVDISVNTETKLKNTFPLGQFYIEGFRTRYRFDRDRNGGDVMIYTREDTLSKIIGKHELPGDIKSIFIELAFRKVKWLPFGIIIPFTEWSTKL